MKVLQELYDSEINFSISTFWDGGFDWKLGDEMNGYKAEGSEDTLESAIFYLRRAAIFYYPDSTFTLKATGDK